MAQRNARSRSELKPKPRNLKSSFGEPISTKRTPKQFTVNGTERPRTNPHANKSTMQQTHNALQILRSDLTESKHPFFNSFYITRFRADLPFLMGGEINQNPPKSSHCPGADLPPTIRANPPSISARRSARMRLSKSIYS